ncbi:hypothetical protein SAMN02983003_1670 [Devosia enhydra]|uniref:Uncharacterized protein n=1 Tax=Devosia enhydra TaxID=665118 RepID=A0A1K2HX16_9HYPH|nr:hypothetical protein [Devosia enhydra]SFZ83479.1 hypothetical protein SAMN02983003_1670 [Devosia enhydra]
MTKFSRSFDVAALSAWDAAHPDNAVRELFTMWALPGAANAGNGRLRIGLRDKYLNFYVKGQSVAKLSIVAGEPTIDVHQAYVDGKARDRSPSRTKNIQSYRIFRGADLSSSDTIALLTGWISTAETYASAEKRFVDDLVGANAGVIDLEMALPANKQPGEDPVAPRMDLVVVQAHKASRPAIAFWEAKCANNPELRAKNGSPKVIGQLKKYSDWVSVGDRLSEVAVAYRNTADVFLRICRHFKDEDCTAPCGDIWRSLANAEAPSIVSKPGIVIGTYWSEGHREEVASGRMQQCADSFQRNGHRATLENEGVAVHEVGPFDETAVLPLLPLQQVPN